MIKYPHCLDTTSIFSEGHRVHVTSSVQSTEQKAEDVDLNVVASLHFTPNWSSDHILPESLYFMCMERKRPDESCTEPLT